MTKPENPPAFPQTIDDMGTMRSVTEGMTLRDYFAGQALQGFFAHERSIRGSERDDWYEGTAIMAYRFSDAMLAERSKND